MSQPNFEQRAEPHEKYEMMCALAAAHELDSTEQQLLDRHLMQCAACRVEFESFRAAVDELAQKPAHTAILDERTNSSAFVQFATRHGLGFSRNARNALASGPKPRLHVSKLAYAVAAVLAFAITTTTFMERHPLRNLQQPVVATQTRSPNAQPTTAHLDQDRIVELESRLNQAESRASQIPVLEKKMQASLETRANLETIIAQRDAEISQLKALTTASQIQLAAAQASITSLTKKSDELTLDLVAEHTRSTSLSDELRDQKAAVEQEKQLTAATHEVRDLMGARRLFMIDVYDGDDRERANRSFGRVFYTEGKSLIFYAFDLDKKHTSKRLTFAAWGQRGKDPATVKQLGVFQVDDVAQKRWVMKVENPDKLRSIDAIFVTVESRPAPDRPTGQKMLYAYLGGQPNHP